MKIKEYLERSRRLDQKLKSQSGCLFSEACERTTDIWDNDAAKGYCLAAVRRAELDPETVEKVLSALSELFGEITVDEAKHFWFVN